MYVSIDELQKNDSLVEFVFIGKAKMTPQEIGEAQYQPSEDTRNATHKAEHPILAIIAAPDEGDLDGVDVAQQQINSFKVNVTSEVRG